MIESIQNIYAVLVAVQLFPMVTLAAAGAYFITRQRFDNAKAAVWVPVGISFVGQLAFAWPDNIPGVFTAFTMGWVQAGLAIGGYSFLDKYGIMERAGKLVQKKMDKGDDNAPTTPTA
jgi:hypothetical protein